jgi:hypothetical protein
MDRMRAGRQTMMANRAFAERQAFDMATNPLVNPMLVANSPYAFNAAMQARQDQQEFASGANRRKLEEEGLRLQNEAATRMLDPAARKREEQQVAFDTYWKLTPEERATPEGRDLFRRSQGEAAGSNTLPEPQTAADAQGNVVSLTPSISALVGQDPATFDTADAMLKRIRELQVQGATISEQDQASIQQYIKNRSMYDANFASNPPAAPVAAMQGLGNWFMNQVERPFVSPLAPGAQPQAIPPQFQYPRMGA